MNASTKPSGVSNYLLKKIESFMNRLVLPKFHPNKIVWLASMSGGKDSSSMIVLLKRWYEKYNFDFTCHPFYVNQWQNSPVIDTLIPFLKTQKLNLISIDAVRRTRETLNYQASQQAPCTECSGIRRDITDELAAEMVGKYEGRPIVVIRGTHYTDVAISLLWRYMLGIEPVQDMHRKRKGNPLVKIAQRYYLAKPLIFCLEDEIHFFAIHERISVSCCGCPGCKNPGRRDIVRETIGRTINKYSNLWELKMPFVQKLLETYGVSYGSDMFSGKYMVESLPKYTIHLPSKLPEMALSFWDKHLNLSNHKNLQDFDHSITLDQIAKEKLHAFDFKKNDFDKIPIPKYLLNRIKNDKLADKYDYDELLMLTAFGPFWGKCILSDNNYRFLENKQAHFFPDVEINDKLGHVNSMINLLGPPSDGELLSCKKMLHFNRNK